MAMLSFLFHKKLIGIDNFKDYLKRSHSYNASISSLTVVWASSVTIEKQEPAVYGI